MIEFKCNHNLYMFILKIFLLFSIYTWKTIDVVNKYILNDNVKII